MTRRAANPGQRPFMVSGDSMKRIAAAVQSYEHGNRSQSPVRFRQVGDDGDALLLCKTTDEWGIDEIATLDVWHDGTPPDESSSSKTVQAVNKVAPVGSDTFVLVGKAGNGSWYLVEIGRDCEQGVLAKRLTEDALDDTVSDSPLETGEGPQVLIHNAGCLKWASLKKITVLTEVSLTESGLEFVRDEIWTFPDAESSIGPTVIAVVDCEESPPPPE